VALDLLGRLVFELGGGSFVLTCCCSCSVVPSMLDAEVLMVELILALHRKH
jgi:hypothetical protein